MMHRTGGVEYVFCQIKRIFRPPSRTLLILNIEALLEESLKLHGSKANQRVTKQDTIGSLDRLPDQAGDCALDSLVAFFGVVLSRGICNHNRWDAVFPFLLAKYFFQMVPRGTKFISHSLPGDHGYNNGCFLCCMFHHGEKRGLWWRVKAHTVQSKDLRTLSSVMEETSSLKP